MHTICLKFLCIANALLIDIYQGKLSLGFSVDGIATRQQKHFNTLDHSITMFGFS